MFVGDINESLFSILEIDDLCLHDTAYCVSVPLKIIFPLELLQQEFLEPFVDIACTAELA